MATKATIFSTEVLARTRCGVLKRAIMLVKTRCGVLKRAIISLETLGATIFK
jgi:hypothetical protein